MSEAAATVPERRSLNKVTVRRLGERAARKHVRHSGTAKRKDGTLKPALKRRFRIELVLVDVGQREPSASAPSISMAAEPCALPRSDRGYVLDVACLRALRAVLNLVLHLRPLGEALVALAADRAVMDEDVRASIILLMKP
jgi:hypothetical protein